MLLSRFKDIDYEVGCDEAGRGCLAGSVFAAAVILPKDYKNLILDDSKKLSAAKRYALRDDIEKNAIAFSVSNVGVEDIDMINILNASILAMHKALDTLCVEPSHILVDGNRFKPYKNIPYTCIVKGDSKYMSIAAASILAKTYRDDYVLRIHEEYPYYNWDKNKTYATKAHYEAIAKEGICCYHRKTFRLF